MGTTRVYKEKQRLVFMECDAEKRLLANCQEAGLESRGKIPKDGNCFFHAVADQLSLVDGGGNPVPTKADQLRKDVIDYLRNNPIVQVK